MKQNSGMITLTLVVFTMIIVLMIIALLQSRILLGIQRTKGFSDSIISVYHAESEIYDTIAKFQLGFTQNTPEETKRLPDGTVLTFTLNTSGNEEELLVKASLPYATTKLKMAKKSQRISSFNTIDIILSLDCTGSMADCANPNDEKNPIKCSNINGPPTRFEELQRGTLAFLKALKEIDTVPIRVGVSIFSGDATWALTPNTINPSLTPIKPDSGNISIDETIETIKQNFQGKTPFNSNGCSIIPEEGTSHASALLFMHNYFKANKTSNIKQVEILVTDGLPTTTVPIPSCGTQYFIPVLKNKLVRCPTFNPILDTTQTWKCLETGITPQGTITYAFGNQEEQATELAACMVTSASKQWKNGYYGQRDPDVDVYIIATFKPTYETTFKKIMTSEQGVFYYDTNNAQDLKNILSKDVIKNIQQTIDEFRIQRVID